MNSVTLMQMPLISSSQVSQSRNHVHQMKLAAVVPPSLFTLKSESNTAALIPPILHLHFFNPADPSIHSNNSSQNILISSLQQPVMFSITVDVNNVIPLQYIIVDFKEHLLDSITIDSCARGAQVKVSICCLNKTVVDNLMDAIMRSLPSAEFGHIKRA